MKKYLSSSQRCRSGTPDGYRLIQPWRLPTGGTHWITPHQNKHLVPLTKDEQPDRRSA